MGGKDAQNFGEGDFIVNVYYTFIKCKSFQVKDFDLTVSIKQKKAYNTLLLRSDALLLYIVNIFCCNLKKINPLTRFTFRK